MYTGIKKVRELNGQNFIDTFKSVRTVGTYAASTGYFLCTRKTELWDLAKIKRIHWKTSNKIYVNGRNVLIVF